MLAEHQLQKQPGYRSTTVSSHAAILYAQVFSDNMFLYYWLVLILATEVKEMNLSKSVYV